MHIGFLFVGLLMVVAVVYAAGLVRRRQADEVQISFDSVEEARRWLATAKVAPGEQVQITVRRALPPVPKTVTRIDDDL